LIRARLYGSEVYAKFMDGVFDKNKHAMQGKHPIIQGNIISFTISYHSRGNFTSARSSGTNRLRNRRERFRSNIRM
jgi:hypothetical protein